MSLGGGNYFSVELKKCLATSKIAANTFGSKKKFTLELQKNTFAFFNQKPLFAPGDVAVLNGSGEKIIRRAFLERVQNKNYFGPLDSCWCTHILLGTLQNYSTQPSWASLQSAVGSPEHSIGLKELVTGKCMHHLENLYVIIKFVSLSIIAECSSTLYKCLF